MTGSPETSHDALLRLLRYARSFGSRVTPSTLCTVANKLFDVMPEILIGVAIDVVVRQPDSFVAAMDVVDPKWQLGLLGA